MLYFNKLTCAHKIWYFFLHLSNLTLHIQVHKFSVGYFTEIMEIKGQSIKIILWGNVNKISKNVSLKSEKQVLADSLKTLQLFGRGELYANIGATLSGKRLTFAATAAEVGFKLGHYTYRYSHSLHPSCPPPPVGYYWKVKQIGK